MTIRITSPAIAALALAALTLAACPSPDILVATCSPPPNTSGAFNVPALTAGVYTVALSGLPEGCDDPGTSEPAAVQANQSTTVTFVVTCTPLAEEQAD